MLCEYGCQQEGKFLLKFKSGKDKWCCREKWRQCPAQLLKIKIIGSGEDNPMFGKSSWNKDLTKESDSRVEKNSKSMKETKIILSSQGKLIAWNKDLTKETDSRVEKYSKSMKITKKGKPNHKRRRPISNLTESYGGFVQAFKKSLYTAWTFPVLKRDNFKCNVCGRTKTLEVHHLLKPFREIYLDCVKKLNLDISKWKSWVKEEIESLEKEVLESHTLENGTTLCRKHHGEVDPYRKRLLRKDEKC